MDEYMSSKSDKNTPRLDWTYEQVTNWRRPEPWDRFTGATLTELDTPDGSATFLFILGNFAEDEGMLTFYGIEAPRHCVMRVAFEWGDITWDEYWTHRDSVCRLILPFSPGQIYASMISPTSIDIMTQRRFQNLDNLFPYEIKRLHLESSWKQAWATGQDPVKAEWEYHEFMNRHGHRFSKSAA